MSLDPNTEQPTSFLAGRRKWAILGALLVMVVAGAMALFQGQGTPKTTTTSTTNESTNEIPSTNRSRTFQQVTVPLIADADKDGLPDQREEQLNTNPRLADSDGDGLSDYDEVEVYGVDPLKQDTDGDSFSDGEEVRTGNNPKGAGSLLNLQQTISNINAQ